jgi:hypothetical protein
VDTATPRASIVATASDVADSDAPDNDRIDPPLLP